MKPLHFPSGSIEVADNVLDELTMEDGVTGVAEAPPRPYTYGGGRESIVAALERIFAPAVIGLALTDREITRGRLDRTVANVTAKAAIESAMWDALGKSLDVSVHRLLGGFTSSLQVSHMLGFDSPEYVADQAIKLRERLGITSFKKSR